MPPLKYTFFLMTLLYFFSMVVAPVPKELARQRRRMDELERQPSYNKAAKAKDKHDSNYKKATEKETTARYNKEKTNNPFKKVMYWSEEKSQGRKASKAFSGQVKTNTEIMEKKKAAGVNPHVDPYRTH